MATAHIFRVLLGIRAADKASYSTWWANNIDTGGGGSATFSHGFSSTGNPPATVYVTCAALTAPQLRTLIVRLCTLSGIGFPSGWDAWTRSEKRDWVRSQIPAMMAGANIRAMIMDDNDDFSSWSDYVAAIQDRGYYPVGVV